MRKSIARRLEALEQQAQPDRGIRVFTQSQDDPGVYFEGDGEARAQHDGGPAYTAEDLHALSADGWIVLKIHYESKEGVSPLT